MTSIEFFGESFELHADVSADALADFAEAAAGVDEGADVKASMESVIKVRSLVWDCIADEDLARFKATSKRNRAGIDDWMRVLGATVSQETERPTSLPSGSSGGQPTIVPSSVVKPVDKGLEHFAGRPDLQLAVLHTRTA